MEMYSLLRDSLKFEVVVTWSKSVCALAIAGDLVFLGCQTPTGQADIKFYGEVRKTLWTFGKDARQSNLVRRLSVSEEERIGQLNCTYLAPQSLLAQSSHDGFQWVVTLNCSSKKCNGLVIRTLRQNKFEAEKEEEELHSSKINAIAKFSEKSLLTGGQDGNVRIFSVTLNGNRFELVPGHVVKANFPLVRNLLVSKHQEIFYTSGIDDKLFSSTPQNFQKIIKLESFETKAFEPVFCGEVVRSNCLSVVVFRRKHIEELLICALKSEKHQIQVSV